MLGERRPRRRRSGRRSASGRTTSAARSPSRCCVSRKYTLSDRQEQREAERERREHHDHHQHEREPRQHHRADDAAARSTSTPSSISEVTRHDRTVTPTRQLHAREVHLLDQAGVGDDGVEAAGHHPREVGPGQQPAQQPERVDVHPARLADRGRARKMTENTIVYTSIVASGLSSDHSCPSTVRRYLPFTSRWTRLPRSSRVANNCLAYDIRRLPAREDHASLETRRKQVIQGFATDKVRSRARVLRQPQFSAGPSGWRRAVDDEARRGLVGDRSRLRALLHHQGTARAVRRRTREARVEVRIVPLSRLGDLTQAPPPRSSSPTSHETTTPP